MENIMLNKASLSKKTQVAVKDKKIISYKAAKNGLSKACSDKHKRSVKSCNS